MINTFRNVAFCFISLLPTEPVWSLKGSALRCRNRRDRSSLFLLRRVRTKACRSEAQDVKVDTTPIKCEHYC
jgi:hypothetical protein